MAPAPTPGRVAPPDLWDPVVRLSHWTIAGIVLVNGLLDKGGSVLHVWLGWIGMAVLALRLLWGLTGPSEARFSSFPLRPFAALDHLRQLRSGSVRHFPSHNPAGAMMAYALWAMLAVVIGTGLWMTSGATPMQIAAEKAAVASGDWSVLIREGEDGDESHGEGEKWVEEVHGVAANLILVLALIHVAGVAVEGRAMGRNLVRPMLVGDRSERGR